MRILIATPYFYPVVGGVENYVERVAEQLVTNGWEVHIVTSGERTSTEVRNGMTIHRLRTWFVVSNTPVSPLWSWQIRRLIKQVQPDVINAHAPVPSIALAATLAAGKTPLVVTYHAGSMKKGMYLVDNVISVYESIFLPWMLNRADSIICASEFVRTSFLEKWTSKSSTVTPGVDTDVFVPGSDFVIPGLVVFVGDYRDPRKGLDILVKAIRQLPGVSLRVVGQGEAEPEAHIEYVGIKRGPALVREIQSAQVLVLPSTTDAESFGTVLIEAMACGVAVIGSRIGGVGTVIADGKDGMLVPAGNVTELASAISKVVRTPLLSSKFGLAGRRKAVTKYGWKSLASQTEDVLIPTIGNQTQESTEKSVARTA